MQDRLSYIGECGKFVWHDETFDPDALGNAGEETELPRQHRAVGDIEPVGRFDQPHQRIPGREFLDQGAG